MSDVTRYTFDMAACWYEHPDGEFVEHDAYAKLAAEAQALRKEVAELRKDKARLDRLDQLNVALNAKYGTTYQWQVIVNHNINRLMLGHLQIDLNDSAAFGLPSCRDALDTIMPGALLNQDKENGNG
ncbi:TPA: hypothetical protein ACRXYB_005820 [Pseudomonas aeruginosa]|nr:hypothetical protein [Pseudomonas aeruginosa]HBO3624596.1 hypothetical protein [Pseudomonas aeruginosa]HCJ6265545.1 hypothetical protein [Pseudomonas aeruginosa]